VLREIDVLFQNLLIDSNPSSLWSLVTRWILFRLPEHFTNCAVVCVSGALLRRPNARCRDRQVVLLSMQVDLQSDFEQIARQRQQL